MNTNVTFDILVDNQNICIDNGYLLSLINDYEDKKWCYNKFDDFIGNNIIETALNYEERQKVINKAKTVIQQAYKRLKPFANNDKGFGGEVGEIFLYGVMREYYNALPIVAKIFHKQNRNDNVKGADSIHITIDEANNFEFWYGEAKFYKSLNSQNFNNLIESIKNLLSSNKLKDENLAVINSVDLKHILTNNNKSEEDIQNVILQIKKLLVGSLDDFKTKLHIPIAVLYQCDITANNTKKDQAYMKIIKQKHEEIAKEYFKRHNNTLKIDYIEVIKFHLILFPVPDKEKIIETHKRNINFYQGD